MRTAYIGAHSRVKLLVINISAQAFLLGYLYRSMVIHICWCAWHIGAHSRAKLLVINSSQDIMFLTMAYTLISIIDIFTRRCKISSGIKGYYFDIYVGIDVNVQATVMLMCR